MNECSPSISIRNLSKTFGSGKEAVRALQAIELEVCPGEITMIVGPSGSGKTTLLSCMAGTLHFDSGELNVLGTELEKQAPAQLTDFRAKSIGFIFQGYHLIPTLSCLENVSIPLLIQNCSRKSAFSKAKDVLVKVGLEEKLHRLPKEISGGQQQRVAIARAIVHAPPIVICDEPTSALDHETGKKIMELLYELSKDEKRTVIIVTHDARIFHYAAKIVEMDDGSIKQIIKTPK